MPITKDGFALLTLEDWQSRAGPKSSDQWVDGRSAKEVARAWLGLTDSKLPMEVTRSLATHPAFSQVEKWTAEPEVKLRFDSFAGEPRNSDLLVHAEDDFGPFLIAVEAKADEPFGETIANALATALERYLENDLSNGVIRVQQLAAALLGPRRGDPRLHDIRYQLLTACAGAVCEAERRGIDRAVLLIHEFVTNMTIDKKHHINANDLNRFIARLSHGSVSSVLRDHVYGPFRASGAPLSSTKVMLFVGKATRILRTEAS